MKSRIVEVEAYKILQEYRGKSFLLAVSGGLDSTALFYVFKNLAKKLNLNFSVAYLHHGPSSNSQLQYRDQAKSFVSRLCEDDKIAFFSATSEYLLEGENAMRDFRRQKLEEIRRSQQLDFIVTAHHRNDLLETRLMRLIRDVGSEGLESMAFQSEYYLRPLLRLTRDQLKEYLQDLSAIWLDDPSNDENHYFRNWLRNEWLPALEAHQSGSVQSMMRSLESIVEGQNTSLEWQKCIDEQRFLRTEYISLSESEKRQALAKYFKHIGLQDYGLSHINEFIKRLDVEQKDLTFRLLKRNWRANARHIWCEE